MDIVSIHRDPLTRQITEGVLIKTSEHPLMNYQAEYKQARVVMAHNLGEPPPPPAQLAAMQPQASPGPSKPTLEEGPKSTQDTPPRHVTRRGRGISFPPLTVRLSLLSPSPSAFSASFSRQNILRTPPKPGHIFHRSD